jgi:tripartite-type tricarboxylate transporter receptor subunit TctC
MSKASRDTKSTRGSFVAPAHTPQDIVTRLNTELTRIFTSAEARKTRAAGIRSRAPMAPAAFGKVIADDLAIWVPIVKASGASAN